MADLPDPRAVQGSVSLDVNTRTVTVMPAETGYPTTLWRQGYQRLADAALAERRGRYTAGPLTVWAHTQRARQIAHGQPQDGALKFQFHKGDPAWAELVGTPGLSAIITLDRRRGDILGVRFRGRT
jgi:hypothetical protein